jgi:putative ABC transport system substrate-binding protein
MIIRLIVLSLVLGLLAAPLTAEAQESGKVYRIGYLSPYSVNPSFMEELGNLGWVEGQNLVIEYRSWAGKQKKLPELAAELVDLKVDLIFSVLTVSTHAAKKATHTIPIVFNVVADPVGDGFVASFTQPGGNITGVCNNVLEISGKVLQLLTEAVPEASRVAWLWNAAHPSQLMRRFLEEAQSAANTLGVKLQSVEVREAKDFEPAFAAMATERAQALIVLGEQLTNRNMPQLVKLAFKNKLPMMIHGHRENVRIGALMSYAPVYEALYRRAAHLVDKILKGAKSAELPVELPTHYDFAINLKTAKTLGLTIPPPLLMQANEVFE